MLFHTRLRVSLYLEIAAVDIAPTRVPAVRTAEELDGEIIIVLKNEYKELEQFDIKSAGIALCELGLSMTLEQLLGT